MNIPLQSAQQIAKHFIQGNDAMELPAITLTDLAQEIAEQEFCKDMETFSDWLAGSSGEREPSVYWGPISTNELMSIALWGRCTPEQTHAAMRTIRRRYLTEFSEQVAASQETPLERELCRREYNEER